MKLDKMRKDDLVDLARKLTQELKMAKKEKVKEELDAEELPLVATSAVRKDGKDYVVKLKFDFDSGQAAVVERTEYPSTHMCLYEKEKLDVLEVEDQVLKGGF